jgi:hypothetical protein
LQHDEAFNAHDAELVLRGVRPVFFDANYGREAFFIYLMASVFAVLGRSALAVRLTGMLCGLGGQVLLYLLVRRMFGRRAGVLALGLSAISFWHLFDSRLGLRAISLPLLQTLSLYLLWLGLTGRRRLYWILSGAALGLCLYTYLSSRIAPVVTVAFLLYVALVRRETMRGQWFSALLLFLTAAMVFAPFGAYMLQHPGAASARLRVLGSGLGQVMAGDLKPLLTSSMATLGMFTFGGDPEWRYGLPGLPVFDPLTGLFFYAGLGLCLVRWRDPRRGLLLIWMVAMLAPSALTDSAPSTLRAVGALPAVLATPALGLVGLWDLLRQRAPRFEVGVFVGIPLSFVVLGALTCHRYFTLWARAPEARRIYEADIAEAARYLNSLPDDPLVCLSSDYAFDLDRYALVVQLRPDRQIRWFDGRQAFVLPAAGEDRPVLYIYTASTPIPPLVAERYLAGLAPAYQPLDARGEPIVTVFRLSGEELALRRAMRPTWPLDVGLGQDVRLVGYNLPPQASQGEVIRAVLYWEPRGRFRRDFAEAPVFFVHLCDAQGHLWAQSDRIGYPAWDWQADDLVLEWFDLQTTPDFPPMDYWPRVGMSAKGGRLPVLAEDGQQLGFELRLEQSTQVAEGEAAAPAENIPIRTRCAVEFGQEIALRGVTLRDEARPGETLTLALFWQATSHPTADYAVRIRLADASGGVVYERVDPLWPGVYPSSHWQPGAWVRSYHEIALAPTVPSGELSLQVALIGDSGSELGASPGPTSPTKLQVKGHKREMAPPEDLQHPLHAQLGSAVALLGYSLQTAVAQPGETVWLTLYWQARQKMATSYAAFVHLLAADNSIVGQTDGPPVGGDSPTTGWIEGEVVSDPYEVPIKPGIPDGDYVIEVGMYDPADLVRLPVTVDGREDPDRRIVLGKVRIQH